MNTDVLASPALHWEGLRTTLHRGAARGNKDSRSLLPVSAEAQFRYGPAVSALTKINMPMMTELGQNSSCLTLSCLKRV
jgi:hypothetical protein